MYSRRLVTSRLSDPFSHKEDSQMNVGISELAPVIYCGTAGGAGEYPASDGGAPLQHILDGGVPANGTVVEAWYAPYDNIAALPNFSQIDVRKYNDKQVQLGIAAYSGKNDRIRLRITVLYTTP
jgi:hypothetical protein